MNMRPWQTWVHAQLYPRVTRWLSDHRGLVVTTLALPASYVSERLRVVRDFAHRHLSAAPEKHEQRVKHVQDQVRRVRQSGDARPMCTARPAWQAMSSRTATYKNDHAQIDVDLRDILELDETRQVVRVEPLVNMGQLTRYLLPRGWSLAVMVEMEDLTVGGVVMGGGMETTCHRFGLIQETVASFELVLPDGERVLVTRDSDPELFHALPWSHGTLGFLVSVELALIPIRPYVRQQYEPFHSLEDFASAMHRLAVADEVPDLLEGTLYSRNSGVIMCGWFDEAPVDRTRINPINRWYKPWFYKHAQTALERGGFEEHIPIRHFYHRHTRSLFWELETLIPFGNHPLYRALFGWLGAPKVSWLKRTMTPQVRQRLVEKHVVQDIVVPIRELASSVRLFDELFEIYPLLVFPIRLYDHGELNGFLPRPAQCEPGKDWEMYVDLGAYGIPAKVLRGQPWKAANAVRRMEAYTRSVLGFSMLYQDIFMTREEFEATFDHRLYRRVRERLGAVGALPEIWDKVKPQHQLPAPRRPRAAPLEHRVNDWSASR